MNEVYVTDGTLDRLNAVKKAINEWVDGEYREFTETQILEICIGFTLASIVSADKGYSIGSILKSAVIAADDNRQDETAG